MRVMKVYNYVFFRDFCIVLFLFVVLSFPPLHGYIPSGVRISQYSFIINMAIFIVLLFILSLGFLLKTKLKTRVVKKEFTQRGFHHFSIYLSNDDRSHKVSSNIYHQIHVGHEVTIYRHRFLNGIVAIEG